MSIILPYLSTFLVYIQISILQAELQKPRYTKELIVKWINQFKYGDVNSREYQKRIIDTFINAIYLFDDKMVLTYNFKGGIDTITLSDIEAVMGSDLNGGTPPHKALWINVNKEDKQILVGE